MQYFIAALKQYADFTGRATRTEYWMFILFYLIFYIAAAVVDTMVLGTMVLTSIFALALLVPSIAIAARRLHDTGRTGWWQLIMLVPLIGTIVLLIFLILDSDDTNQYGPNPKQTAAAQQSA